MLATPHDVRTPPDGQGCLRAALAELERQEQSSAFGENRLRQRLEVLAQRLARVQSWGGEYARVGFSEYAEKARSATAVEAGVMEDAGHLPVLLDEVLELLAPALRPSPAGGATEAAPRARVIVDCTIGLGGHAEALIRSAGAGVSLIGIDLDESNLVQVKKRLLPLAANVRLFSANFADIRDVLAEAGLKHVDAVLADLGVCSLHLDQPERGFSFQAAGPLDMRLSGRGMSAADLVNAADASALADIIWRYGEERFSRRIAAAIVRARKQKRIERTDELAAIVERVLPRRRPGVPGIHPATRTFQALRIAVNRELDNLQRLLEALPEVLTIGGRAAVISFHSLEDRLVKHAFAELARQGRAALLTRKPRVATDREQAANPRSRSAKLRAMERLT